MAATDQTYRNQKRLDTVFGVSCVLMLISIIWMFADDYMREWKTEQRVFRDVEVAISDRSAMAKLPDPRQYRDAEVEMNDTEDRVKKYHQERLDEIDKAMNNLRAPLVRSDEKARTIKADLDSRKSFYDLEVERKGPDSPAARQYKKDIEELQKRLAVAQDDLDKKKQEMQKLLNEKSRLEEPVTLAKAKVKKLREDFDIQAKNAQQKRWRTNDWFRSLPIIDAFQSPLRIQQFTLNDLPIDYNFKYVTRFDRCTTCHLGIDRPAYDKVMLHGLAYTPVDLLQMEVADSQLAEVQEKVKAKEKDEDLDQKVNRLRKLGLAYQAADRWASPSAGPLLTDLGYDIERQAGEPTVQGIKQLRGKTRGLKKNKVIKAEIKRIQGSQLLEEVPQQKIDLSESRVNEFCVHPRLDLFVDVNSPHSAEKFGCTICHGGQGSATDFFYASHTPNNAAIRKRWTQSPNPDSPEEDGHNWKANHDWEFPMQPMRFVETSCLKCHHRVTDLIREGNRNEAPKLVRGYNLVRENGCFGCHEIAGIKSGASVGPDLRLEPVPPLEDMSAEERAKAAADPLNPPGTMRKVGPSLYRLSEKTHPGWVKRWIKAPREYRPTTRMPHFYGLSNNDPTVLPETQKKFPDAEIGAIAHYLFYESQGYLDNIDTARKADYLAIVAKFRKVYDYDKQTLDQRRRKLDLSDAEKKQLAKVNKEITLLKKFEQFLNRRAPADPKKRAAWKNKEFAELKKLEKQLGLLQRTSELMDSIALTDQDKKELKEMQRRLEVRGEPLTLARKFAESMSKAKLPSANDKAAIGKQALNGRRLFTQKGCLACHSHKAVTEAGPALMPNLVDPKDVKEVTLPAIDREKYFKDQPTFGPNLSMLREKLGTDATGKDYASKRRWLIQWIMDPTFHSPRTLMPVTHLTFEEAAAVAAWLLNQDVAETGADWDKVEVPESDLETLEALAHEGLKKVMPDEDIATLFKGKYGSAQGKGLPLDETEMIGMIQEDNTESARHAALKWYIGKKAIGRQGCFGCHNIPGFDYAKPIGTPLNDWGKKDPERLAFEDIKAYVKDHYDIVDSLTTVEKRTKKVIPRPLKGKKPKPYYESFFYDALKHHSREGFLHQKLREPRSYDYNRLRTWEDRLRMPWFKFARAKRAGTENDRAFRARADLEEAEAQEAVMTFILGLVAEPIPGKFVNDPAPDRLAAIKGRQVLDKYNCAACHLVQPSTFEFKVTPEVIKELNVFENANPQFPEGDYGNNPVTQPHSYPLFAEHNAWKSQKPVPKDRLTVHGVIKDYYEDPDAEAKPVIVPTEAFRYLDGPQVKEVRANGLVSVPFDSKTKGINTKLVTVQSPTLGGHFGDLLTVFLIEVHKDRTEYQKELNFVDNGYARAGTPPSLYREGEKVQPNWLFEFLRHPQPIRPMARLRMPRFNMSDEEAMALVNYFASESKRDNPAIGLTYPYAKVPQREEDFLADTTRKYVAHYKQAQGEEYQKRIAGLMKKWEGDYAKQLKAVEDELAEAERKLKAAKGKDKEEKDAQAYRDTVARELSDLKKMDKTTYANVQKAAFESQEMYAVDGYRLLTNRNLCLNCHQLGELRASNPESQRGPPLHLAADRLRPDWALRWIANPKRFLTYESVMPQYFPSPKEGEKPPYQDVFPGSPFQQATAVRDVLMNFRKVAEMPANRSGSRPEPAPAGGG